MSETAAPPVPEQIDQAKSELQDIAIKPPVQDQDSYRDATPPIDTPAHDSLASHLQTGEPTARTASPSTLLDDLSFRDVGLAASEDVKKPAPHTESRGAEESMDKSAKEQRLREEAKAVLNTRDPRITDIVYRIQPLRDIRGTSMDRNSGEYDAFVVLLNSSNLTNNFGADSEKLSKDIHQALRMFRKDYQNESRVVGLGMNWNGGHHNSEAGTTRLLQDVATANGEIKPQDVKALTLVALSCGEPGAALRILKQGNEMATGDEKLTFADMQAVFQKARDLYPLYYQHDFDQEMATLGEDFLPNDPDAQAFITQAAQRAKSTSQEIRDRWYQKQEVTKVEGMLDEKVLTGIIDTVVIEGKTWEAVVAEVEKQAGDMADAKAANVVARELARRIRTEGGLDLTHEANEISRFFEKSPLETGQRAETKRQAIDSAQPIYYENQLQEILANPARNIGMQQLVGFLKNPSTYKFAFEHAVTELIEKRRRERSGTLDNTRLAETRKILSQTLVKGVTFLQAQAEVPEIKRVLDKEFAFKDWNTSLIDTNNLENAGEVLQNWFSDVVDETSGKTLYDEALEENQLDEDARIAEQIAESIPSKRQKLTEQGLQTAEVARTELIQGTTAELTTEQERAQQVEALHAASEELANKIAALDAQREQTESIVPVSGLGGRLANMLARKENVTPEQKQATVEKIAVDITAAREEYALAMSRLGEMGPIDAAKIPKLAERLQRLESLRPAT